MTHPETAEHGGHPAAPASQTLFPPAEWEELRQSDITGAKYIIGLMVGIFVVGLFLYTGVLISVATRSV
jgi:hypothetical protein